jgi:hypothetical protein
MSTACFILALLSGLCAFGFLIASLVHLREIGAPQPDEGASSWIADLLSGGISSVLRGMAKTPDAGSEPFQIARLGAYFLGAAVLLVILGIVF